MLTGGEQSFDRDGAWAAQGRADAALVERLLDDPYFALPAPKSTGKEYFNLGYVTERLAGREIRPEDLLASLTVTTAESVATAIRPYGVSELIVAGGGTRNLTLMADLQARLPGVKMRRTDELGVPEAGKEALVFAIIGFLTLHGLAATVPSCTGAAHASVLGSVTPGRAALAALLAPSQTGQAPARLVVRSPLLPA